MGTSRTPQQFVAKINAVGHATDKARKGVVNQGALTAKKIMLGAAAYDGVPPGSKIAGTRWGVTYGIRGAELPTALVRFTGPFHLVNNDTLPHYIAAGGLGGSRTTRSDIAFRASATRFGGGSTKGAFAGQRRSRGKRALSFNGIARAYIFHPGTTGKHIFQTARAVASKSVPAVMATEMKGAWRRAIA